MNVEVSRNKRGDAAFVHYLNRVSEHHRDAVAGGRLPNDIERLRRWQCERLVRTHADLLSDPRYAPAMQFFMEELYGPNDFSQRDTDLARVYPVMVQVLSDEALATLGLALELHAFSHELDARLLRELKSLNAAERITQDAYCEAFRRCDNYGQRRYQIELIYRLGNALSGVVRRRSTGMTLRLARRPAKRAGFEDVQGLMERGCTAFRHMEGAGVFMETLVDRELTLLDRIFAGEACPFELLAHEGEVPTALHG